MISVYMKNENEMKLFCRKLQQYEMAWLLQQKRGYYIQISDSVSKQVELLIYYLLLEVWATCTKKDKILDIIRYTYYYENEEEIERILENSLVLLLGDEFTYFDVQNDLQRTVFDWFDLHIDENTLDYEACVQSSNVLADSLLIELVGRAIDELKQEEQYQNFVHAIRGYIASNTCRYSTIHILQGENFSFYQDDGHEFSAHELIREIQTNPVYIDGLDENELNLTPLLAMLPECIYIYGDNPPESKAISVMNIFEERAIFKPINQFPFALV